MTPILLNSSLLSLHSSITIDSLKIIKFTSTYLLPSEKCALQTKLPTMLALCLMLLPSYYAQNYAGIIGSSLSCNKLIFS